VMHLSVAQYKANPEFNQEETFIKTITGRTQSETGFGLDTKWQEVNLREGITTTRNEDMIILWEIYCKNGKEVYFDTFSPMRLIEGDEVRPRQYLPYNQGVFSKGAY